MLKLKEGEIIKSLKRRHPMVLLVEILPLVFFEGMLFIGIAFFIFYEPLNKDFLENFIDLSLLNINYIIAYFLSLIAFFCWILIFSITSHYYLDFWMVTDRRVINAELKGFFSRTLKSVFHDKIQDISVDTQGALGTFFEYGDVQVQTAGVFRQFICKQIPKPYETKEIILNAKRDYARKNKQYNTLDKTIGE